MAGPFVEAQKVFRPTASEKAAIRSFLADQFRKEDSTPDKTTRYNLVLVDLNGDGKPEAVVYVSGNSWCGSGGCNMLVLYKQKSKYTIVGDTTITRLPIRVLSTKKNGWHDLSVFVAGGGILPGYNAKLSFDGREYPENPSAPPAVPLRSKSPGKTLIPDRAYNRSEPVY
jgi:hypothetical protein